MQSYVTTTSVGGRDGYIFQDVYIRSADGELASVQSLLYSALEDWHSESLGNIVIDDHKKDQLDLNRPIKRIAVSNGWIVDGIAITYNLANGKNETLHHGSQFKNADIIDFDPNEILATVFGRAGRQSFYEREMVNNIGFVIFDTVKGTTRTVGPYGNVNGATEGKPFLCSDVIAFGGFAENTDTLGLSGLFFYKDVGKR
ncbi:hypothetical protein TRAPUB_10327 [Trametes pubescens]|uniref:Jacalin-type lectin domain-containing protein n=1 Tax=Trametes pubescens TaxID=154538 RepID=A0A1M2W002_TRAPU|nr:hypothetical protein TRAPUB_10327 [Trametes pubescens]